MSIHFNAQVKKVTVAEKKIKVESAEGSYMDTVRIGSITLEFDASGVDVNTLADFIRGVPISLGLADTQFGLGPEFKS